MKKVMLSVLFGLAFTLLCISVSAKQYYGFGYKPQITHQFKMRPIYYDQISNSDSRIACWLASGAFITASLLKHNDYTWVSTPSGPTVGYNGDMGYWKKIPFYKDPGKILPFCSGLFCFTMSFAF